MAKVITKNREAKYNYELLETFEAGIALKGWEVKSIRDNKVQLKNAFVSFNRNEMYLSNMHVAQYMHIEADETAPRKLLLHKSQIKKMKEKVKVKGITIVPIILKWSSKGKIKVDIAIARGKNKIDKRETIKKRDQERESRKFI